MSGPYIARHKDEILDFMRDMTKGPEQKHPQAPSIRITEKPAFSIEVTFTNGKLARDLGRDLHKKYRGELEVLVEISSPRVLRF